MSRNPDLMLNRSVIAQQVPAGGVAIQSKEKAGTSLNGWFGCVRFSHCFALPPMCFVRFIRGTVPPIHTVRMPAGLCVIRPLPGPS